jgi:hypothetical protein
VGFPGRVEVIGGEFAAESGFVDFESEVAEVVECGVAGFGLAGSQGECPASSAAGCRDDA